ncbi:HipA family kinase [Brevibacillus halotolerans]|uniref:HipA family kinase n=1 Tax=Brevibacillus laterosporus TaxID=1465 RepID=UPI0003B22D45|nr:HipA family kinase [Brevibacillus laterosporus]ERM19226.1 hypothetical protein P615_10585 [Brevibacillus laterosporus PE36]MDF9414024.1 hypothetical protein [Brevibacillus laterosporus]WPS86826.1 HipA family kinase [Brevibacillus halotolerans]
MRKPGISWVPVQKYNRPLGPVWQVRKGREGNRQIGFFKYMNRSTAKRLGPVLAMELLSYRLARKLGISVAKIEVVTIQGKRGIVSHKKRKGRLYSWEEFYRRKGPRAINELQSPERLIELFVFDIWIVNVDRHNENIIIFPTQKAYDFYAIDHSMSLLGTFTFRKIPWYSKQWEHVALYNHHYLRGLTHYIQEYSQVKPFIQKIQRLSPVLIKQTVRRIPGSLLSLTQKQQAERVLLNRQKNLHHLVERWLLEYKGKI